MAATANPDGFSIREYAAKMRSVDVAKCWPFVAPSSRKADGDEEDRLLPPISVVKFRWWADLLPPPPPNKGKSARTPKKRSIVEIFAAAPQIQRPDDDVSAKKIKNKKKQPDKEKICRFKYGKKAVSPTTRGLDCPPVSNKSVKQSNVKCLLATQKKPKLPKQSNLSPPVRGILKNHVEDISTEDRKMSGGNSCSIQHTSKHVRFSEEERLKESDDELSALEIIESDDNESNNTGIGTETQQKHPPDSPMHNGICQEKAIHFPEKPISRIQVSPMFCQERPITSRDHPCNASSVADTSYSAAATSSIPRSTNSDAWPHKPTFCQLNWPYKSPCCQPPTEPICSFGPFPEWKQRGIAIGERCRSDNFVGLPLNSHGELIQSGYTMLANPPHNFAIPRSTADYLGLKESNSVEQLNFFPVPNYIGENSNASLPARLGVTDMYSNPSRPNDEESSGNILLNKTQPTMRLMGKDVAIGKGNENVFRLEDGKVWTDKEIVAEHHHRHHPSFHGNGNSGKRYFQPDWILRPTLGKHESAAPPASRFSRGYLNFNTSLPFQYNTFASSVEKPTIQQPCQSHFGESAFPVMKSAFEFPFLHPDYSREGARPSSWFGSPSETLPPWLLDATQQRGRMTTSPRPFLDNPSMIASSSFQVPVSYPYNPNLLTSYRNQNNLEFCKRKRRRSRAMADQSSRPAMARVLDMQGDSTPEIGLRRDDFICGRSEGGSNRDGTGRGACFVHDGLKSDSPMSSSRRERCIGFGSV